MTPETVAVDELLSQARALLPFSCSNARRSAA